MKKNKRLKLKGKKRIIICVLIIIAIIVEFVAYRAGNTKAQEVISVNVSLTDFDSKIPEEQIQMDAKYDNGEYYIILPESINNKAVIKYYAETVVDTQVGLLQDEMVYSLAGVSDRTRFSEEIVSSETIEAAQPILDTTSSEDPVTEPPKTTEPIEENTDIVNTENTPVDNTDNEITEPETNEKPDEKTDETELVAPETENSDTNTTNTIDETNTDNNIVDNNTVDNTVNNTTSNTTNETVDYQEKIIRETKIVELLPGNKYYISEEDAENKSTKITVKYDSKTVKDIELYNQTINTKMNDNQVSIKGFLPNNAQVTIRTDANESIADSVNVSLGEDYILTSLFRIDITVNGQVFDLEEYGEELTVTIDIDSIEKDYKVLEIDSPDEISNTSKEGGSAPSFSAPNGEISKIEREKSIVNSETMLADNDENTGFENITIKENNAILKPDSITFKVSSNRTYAIVQSVIADNDTQTDTIEDVIVTGVKWDGTIATSFSSGDGSITNPYLILEGSELAYLAQQVNNGTNYDGKYFQLTCDIDLNDRQWTPIGTNGNSFSGIFDGAGHSISNAVIETEDDVSSGSSYSYGIFGSIMGVSAIAEIRNTEFNNVEININDLNSNVQIKAGIVVGTMYRKSKVSNVIVKSGNIRSNSYSYSITNNNTLLAVGGIAGEARNTNTSTADPGDANRYSIENCFVTLTINTSDFECGTVSSGGWFSNSYDQGTYVTQISSGGIIGRIRSQNVWPENCFVNNLNVTATGMVGPIFGGVYNNTSVTNGANLNIFWNGNDAANGTNLTMTSYYNTYRVNNTTFTSSYTTGDTPTNSTTYRRTTTQYTTVRNNPAYYPGYVQGMNKGTRQTNVSTMVASMNTYNTTNLDGNIEFLYSNSEVSFKRRFSLGITDNGDYTYTITHDDPYNIGSYDYKWYIDGSLDETKTTETEEVRNESFADNVPVKVVVSDGTYYGVVKFAVPKLYVQLEFTEDLTDVSNFKIIAEITGPGTLSSMYHLEDYTFTWYEVDLAGLNETKIEGANALTLENAEEGIEYKLVATNNSVSDLSTQGSHILGERNVVYVYYTSYNNTYGNDNRLGETPETAVRTLSRAYNLLPANTSRNKNIIVLLNDYTSSSIYNSSTSTTYNKNATVTGAYNGIRYNSSLYMNAGTTASNTSSYRYICGDTTFQYMTWEGAGYSLYFYCQGYDLTMGEEITMSDYANANTNQGLITGSAPAVHIFGAWCQYNRSSLPANKSDGTRQKSEIVIKSGAYGRVLGGGSSGTSGSASIYMTTSHNFVGTNLTTDSYDIEITADIKNSTKGSYTYDINLLGGGATAGNTYGNAIVNVKNGSIGRVLGGSIGDSSYVPSNNGNTTSNSRWTWPINTYIGSATINILGGNVTELYGGSLGRNMSAIRDGSDGDGRDSDSYFYGTININVSGGTVTENIYGAGAGAVTGYSTLSSDPYKSYGENINTSVNINITGGNIQSNVYGGGYGYTEYLTLNVITDDGGTLYGNSNISISGSPVISGSIYGGGCGYNASSLPNLAQVYGDTTVSISGSPTITGSVFGAGAGISGLPEMAKLIGTSTINLNADLTCNVFGGGNIAKLTGNVALNINSGTHSGSMYGGGNVGIVDGNTHVYVNGTTNTGNIFGGGNQATVNETIVDINDGTNNNSIFGGGNEADVSKSTVNILGGTNTNVFGCGNKATSANPAVYIRGGTTQNVYGGGNEASVTETHVYLYRATVTNIYGGSNSSGTIGQTNVDIQEGYATTVYGGNNAGGTVTTSNVTINQGNIDTVFGGNNANGTTVTSNVVVNTNVPNVYGGNNAGGTTTTSNVTINNGQHQNVFGGGNEASTGTTNVNIVGGTTIDAYGGGNQAGITVQTNVNVTGGFTNNVYGGSNQSGTNTVAKSNVIINEQDASSSNATAINVYGGNNASGVTLDPNITFTYGVVSNVYGGGNEADVTKTTVRIIDGEIDNVYGGGNAARVTTNTDLQITGGIINENVYGGGNEGIVSGTSNASIKDATVLGSAYGGGNGISAIVQGNSTLTIQGNAIIGFEECSAPQEGCVFGGGNAASTGTSEHNANSILNIVGGTIYGNTYGGANTSVVYGSARVNIGMNAVGDNSLTMGDIHIYGTSFGGGEANASGSETFDWDTIIVTNGINVVIDAQNHNTFLIDGSIFGSGNASATGGTSTVCVRNYGTPDHPKSNISLQRTNIFILQNSSIAVDGATDRANEYASVYYSISRIDHLKLENNSTLYLNYGANLLKEYSSLLVDSGGNETLATVTIDEDTGATTRNVDNRIYMFEGKNLNISTNENNTAYGNVNGMSFLGIFTSAMNPAATTAYYNHNINNGDTITNAGTFSLNSYVLGAHKKDPEHNIKADGFYTNVNNEGVVKSEYVGVTPEDDTYYMWVVGDAIDVTVFEVTLTASKYATLGTVELPLTGFSTPNTKFFLTGFAPGLKRGIELINNSEIETIAWTEDDANSKFGLNVKNGKSGWITDNSNNFYSANEGYFDGNTNYQTENLSITPSLTFCLYHSQNISINQPLGTAKIRYQVLVPIDDLNYKVSYMDIIVTMISNLYPDDFYEAAITPGEEFELFTTTETNITDDSMFSVYYSLYIPDFSENDLYDDYATYNRCLVSRDLDGNVFVLPANTTITMIDIVRKATFYYNVTQEDVQNNKYIYEFTDFIRMGSTNEHYDGYTQFSPYYIEDLDLLYENYIFQVNFSQANITQNQINKTLLMELQDTDGETLVGVLGIQRESTKYSVYTNNEAIITANTSVFPETTYLAYKDILLTLTTNYQQEIVDTKVVYDTTNFDKKLGVKITIFDSDGNQLNSDSLLGVFFVLDGQRYYPRIDGSTRIKIADRVSNVLSRIIINTEQNSTLATGEYTIKVETFGSSDGIYYGLVASDYSECNIYIINGAYGLKVDTVDEEKIINKTTGLTQNNTNDVNSLIQYSSSLEHPIISVKLERRSYDSIFSKYYSDVDLSDYVEDELTEFINSNEYTVTSTPDSRFTHTLHFKDNLVTGTYKLVYRLYDSTNYIGEVYEYIIIR